MLWQICDRLAVLGRLGSRSLRQSKSDYVHTEAAWRLSRRVLRHSAVGNRTTTGLWHWQSPGYGVLWSLPE